MAILLEEKYDQVRQLIQMGKERGYLLYDEVNDILPAEVHSSEEIDDLLSTFERYGIDIYEDANTAKAARAAAEPPDGGEVETKPASSDDNAAEEPELDLTPGVEVADVILALLDTNHDGVISAAEGEAYAKLVMEKAVLEVDKQRLAIKLTRIHYPPVSEMQSGTGTIQLRASVEFALLAPGPHLLYFQNRHQTNESVYLINAYLPRWPAIRITRQKRDDRQTEIWIDYTFTSTNTATEPVPTVRPDPAAK